MFLNGVLLRLFRTAEGVLSIVFVSSLFLSIQSAQADQSLRVFKDEYVVELKPAVAALGTGAARAAEFQAVRSLGLNTRLVRPPQAPGTVAALTTAPVVVPYDASNDYCVTLLKQGIAESCSPNFELKALANPNDPQFSGLWGLSANKGIDGPRAWDVTTGSTAQVVAVIDTGVDYTHPDLAANMWTNTAEVAGNGIDDDSNGYVDDVHGMSAVNHSGNPMDDNGHGTHVSGTIGAAGNNAVGVTGINWNTKIMGLKFLAANGSGSLAGAVEAINYMIMMKNRGVNVRVVNNSWGGGGFSAALFTAIERARDAGIIFVAAAGNESNDNDASPAYPASYEVSNVISVAAIDQNQNMAGFSNYGAVTVDIAAPGVGIISTYPGNRYASLSGTSMATPHVAGALALLLAAAPEMSTADAITRLYDAGVDSSALAGVVRTGRKLNVARMVLNETSPVPLPTPTPRPCQYTVTEEGYAPDTSADSAAVVVQADEFNFYQVPLPFSFPYFGQSESSITVSPNGVAYVGRVPTTMDYANTDNAPVSAIAALQTDLVAEAAPYGVRVAVGSDRVTVYWLANHYYKRGQGDVMARLTIHQSGRIENSIAFGNGEVESYVQQRATVGMTGQNTAWTATYASNSSAIRNNLTVSYVPNCDSSGGQPAPLPQKLTIQGRDSRGDWSNDVTAGRSYRVNVKGSGNGTMTLNVSLNGRQCEGQKTVIVTDGKGTFGGHMPALAEGYRSFQVGVSTVKDSAKISRNGGSRRSSKRARPARFDLVCNKIIGSLAKKRSL